MTLNPASGPVLFTKCFITCNKYPLVSVPLLQGGNPPICYSFLLVQCNGCIIWSLSLQHKQGVVASLHHGTTPAKFVTYCIKMSPNKPPY